MDNPVLQTGKNLFTWGEMLLNQYPANDNNPQTEHFS